MSFELHYINKISKQVSGILFCHPDVCIYRIETTELEDAQTTELEDGQNSQSQY